jgi:hypothetical protein
MKPNYVNISGLRKELNSSSKRTYMDSYVKHINFKYENKRVVIVISTYLLVHSISLAVLKSHPSIQYVLFSG